MRHCVHSPRRLHLWLRFPLAASLLLVFACAAPAQSTLAIEAARAQRLLTSPQWIDRAWGAYLAGHLHSATLEQPLLDSFREAAALRNATWRTEEWGYVAALFDAAIQSGITVPPALLEPFEENWRDPVIILLARDHTTEDSLLRLREQKLGDPQWLAVSNLLAGRQSQLFFAKALSEVEISQTFDVTTPGRGVGYSDGIGDGGCGDGILAMPAGYPPIAWYRLVVFGQAGDVLLAEGPRTAYYRTVLVPTDRQTGIGSCGGVDRQETLTGYMARLGNLTPQEASALFRRHTNIVYADDAGYRRSVEDALNAQESAIRAFVQTAQSHGLGRVAGLRLNIAVQVHDFRVGADGALPAATPREFVLQ